MNSVSLASSYALGSNFDDSTQIRYSIFVKFPNQFLSEDKIEDIYLNGIETLRFV